MKIQRYFTVFLTLLLLASFLSPFFVLPSYASSKIALVQGPMNPQISVSDNASYYLMTNGSSYQAYFKNNSRTSNAIRFQNKGFTFDMDIATSQLHWYNSTLDAIIGMVAEMNPQNTQATSSGNTLTYLSAWINTDLKYQVYSDQLKETLVIHNVSAPSSSIKPDYLQYVANCYYNNSLTIYANGVGYLHPSNQKFTTNGTINFNDAGNNTMYWLPTPFIYDSVGNSAIGLYAVTANNGILIINIRVPKTFLDSAVFPTYFDPILRVQGNARGTSTSTTIAVTLGSSPTNGNLLIAVVGALNLTDYSTIVNITETGVTWTRQLQVESINGYTTHQNGEIWAGVVGAGASTSVTVYLSGAASLGAVADICEYSGLLTLNFLDKTATNPATAVALSGDTNTTATTTHPVELLVGGMFALRSPAPTHSTPTNGFTLLDGGAGTSYLSIAYLETAVNSTQTANTGTSFSATANWYGLIATFIAATTSLSLGSQIESSTVLNSKTLYSPSFSSQISGSSHITNHFGWPFTLSSLIPSSISLNSKTFYSLSLSSQIADLTHIIDHFTWSFTLTSLIPPSSTINVKGSTWHFTPFSLIQSVLGFNRLSLWSLSVLSHFSSTSNLNLNYYVPPPTPITPTPPGPPIVVPSFVLDINVQSATFMQTLWDPLPKFNVFVINKGVYSGDIVFNYTITHSLTTNVVASGTQTVFLDANQGKTIVIQLPSLPDGHYFLSVVAQSPASATGTGDLIVTSPFYGQLYFWILIAVIVLVVVLLVLKRRH